MITTRRALRCDLMYACCEHSMNVIRRALAQHIFHSWFHAKSARYPKLQYRFLPGIIANKWACLHLLFFPYRGDDAQAWRREHAHEKDVRD